MLRLESPLEGFSPALYLATLTELAHADGLQPIEEELLAMQAEAFGIDRSALPEVPANLTELPFGTRVLLYRDALILAHADGVGLSDEESSYLLGLAQRLGLREERIEALGQWVGDYVSLFDRFDGLLMDPGERG